MALKYSKKNSTYSISSLARIASIASLVIGVFFSFYIYHHLETDVKNKLGRNFHFVAEQASFFIEKRLELYNQSLMFGAAFAQSHDEITRDIWSSFVKDLRLTSNYSGIQALGINPIVLHKNKEEHIAKARSEGFENYNIVPAGDREIYVPVAYSEPYNEKNKKALGFDVYSEKRRRDSLSFAAANSTISMSNKILLMQDGGDINAASVLKYAPFYKKDVPLGTAEERMQALRGYVSLPFRVSDLVKEVLGNKFDEFALEIYDGNNTSLENLMYTSKDHEPLRCSNCEKIEIQSNDKIWTLRFVPLKPFYDKHSSNEPFFALMFGLAVSIAFFSAINYLINTRKKALELAENMTRELAISEERFRVAIDGSRDCIWDWNLLKNEVFLSRRGQEILGIPFWKIKDNLTESMDTWMDRIHPEDKISVQEGMDKIINGELDVFENKHRERCVDGEYIWIYSRGTVIERDENGVVTRIAGASSDITEQVVMENNLKKSESNLLKAQQLAKLGSWEYEAGTYSFKCSKEFCNIFDIDEQKEISISLLIARVYEKDRQRCIDEFKAVSQTKATTVINYRIYSKDGDLKCIKGIIEPFLDANNEIVLYAGAIQDVTEQMHINQELERANKELEAKSALLEKISISDSLTSIPNRRYFDNIYNEAFETCKDSDKRLAVLVLDVDFFKAYNDHYGHLSGDKCLVKIAQSIEKRPKHREAPKA